MQYKGDLPLVVGTLIASLQLLVGLAGAIVVDGDKKKIISPTKNQSDEKSMIDPFNTKTCGMFDSNSNDREFVNMAREGQFPWMVSFQIKMAVDDSFSAITSKNAEDLHFCCGSFISDKWILSAAHCFAPENIKKYLEINKLKAVAGSHIVSSRNSNNRNLTIERIYYHSKFDELAPIGFDISLVELKDKVEFSQKRKTSALMKQSEPFMNTICLPLKDKKYKFNETARIVGWGLSSDKDATSMPSKLLTTDILLNDKDACVQKYAKAMKSDKPKHQQDKYDDFLCASYGTTRDACQSDSGGPLIQFSGGKAVVIGIVSYGIGCATKGIPGLYTRTSAYINWIKDITKHGKEASVAFKLVEGRKSGQGLSSNSDFGSSASSTSGLSSSTTTTTQSPASRKSTQVLIPSHKPTQRMRKESISTSWLTPELATEAPNSATNSDGFKFFNE